MDMEHLALLIQQENSLFIFYFSTINLFHCIKKKKRNFSLNKKVTTVTGILSEIVFLKCLNLVSTQGDLFYLFIKSKMIWYVHYIGEKEEKMVRWGGCIYLLMIEYFRTSFYCYLENLLWINYVSHNYKFWNFLKKAPQNHFF